jgi:ethanolamine utilization microcompartment shell protein EutS
MDMRVIAVGITESATSEAAIKSRREAAKVSRVTASVIDRAVVINVVVAIGCAVSTVEAPVKRIIETVVVHHAGSHQPAEKAEH